MASLGKLVTLFVVILVAAEGEAQVASYFSLYGSPSVSTYNPPSKAPSPTPSTYPSPSTNPATNYPNTYPASYPSSAYTPPGYNTPATGYNALATGYNQPATAYNQPATGYNQPVTGYNQPATGYNQPATGYNPAQSAYNYVYPMTYNQGQGIYTAPLAPQYVAPYQNGYNNNYNMNSNCTDQSCKPTECCEFNGKRFVCVEQNQDLLQTEINGYGVYCARAKRCYSNGDCPANHCCVIRLDIPYDNSQYGSYGAQNSYGSYGNYGYPNLKTERGECLLYAAVNSTCRRPVEGSATSSCPCVSGTVCTFSVINPLTGICQTPLG